MEDNSNEYEPVFSIPVTIEVHPSVNVQYLFLYLNESYPIA